MEIARSEHDGVVTLTMDDGKRNALDTTVFDALEEAFDACSGADAIVLAGREQALSAGLNLKLIAELDRAGIEELLRRFGQVVLRIWLEPRPTVCAATGHAVAAGTMLALACDHAVAAEGAFAWGLTETRVDLEIPRFGIELARANVRADRLEDLLLPGLTVGPEEAVAVGFADELAPPDQVVARAQEHARALAELPRGAYAGTKRRLRGETADRVLAGLRTDITALLESRQGLR